MKRKVAVVTGSAKGIGAALIKEFARQGYDVVINYNTSKNDAYQLKEYINKNYNVGTLCIKCDVTNEQDILKMRDMILKEYDKIDVLVNNAAYAFDNHIDDKSKEEFMRVMEVNVCGPFLVSKHFYNYLNNGVIVNVSSTDAVDTYNPISMDYSASKAALNSLTKTFSQEFKNTKVIGVMPAWTNTEAIKEMNKDYLKDELNRIGQKKLYEPEEVACDILNLINDDSVESGDIFYECKRNNKCC